MIGVPPAKTTALVRFSASQRLQSRPSTWKYRNAGSTLRVCRGLRDATQTRCRSEESATIRAKPCSPSVVPVGRRGEPLRPGIIYRDNRATAESRALRERFGDAVLHARTGQVPTAFHTAAKIGWIRAHEPATFAAAGLALTGPGIKTVRQFAFSGMPKEFEQQLRDNRARFPQGVDIVLAASAHIAALPRSVRLVRER